MCKVERMTRLNVQNPQWTVVAKHMELLQLDGSSLRGASGDRHGPLSWEQGYAPVSQALQHVPQVTYTMQLDAV